MSASFSAGLTTCRLAALRLRADLCAAHQITSHQRSVNAWLNARVALVTASRLISGRLELLCKSLMAALRLTILVFRSEQILTRCRYTLLCGKPPFEAADGSLQGTYQNIERAIWTFDKPPDHPHQIVAPHHPPSPAAQDLITKLLCHNYTERATIETIESHPFLCARLPSTLPISALRVPPEQHDMHDIHGMRTPEPRLLFVCVEPTYGMRHRPAPMVEDNRGESSKLLVKPRPLSRWRCCVAGLPAPVAPAAMHPVSRSDCNADMPTTYSDLSTDTGGHSNEEDMREFRVRPFYAALRQETDGRYRAC